jgi:hypothetical protein
MPLSLLEVLIELQQNVATCGACLISLCNIARHIAYTPHLLLYRPSRTLNTKLPAEMGAE